MDTRALWNPGPHQAQADIHRAAIQDMLEYDGLLNKEEVHMSLKYSRRQSGADPQASWRD